ncbi:MAG: FIST C-terminal domain-containing protein [Spirochaetales bacterium]|jgi:hypothetical protein|nr:FIST C-terminal domain-containing protein [Spirochaetales bacterium]
MLKFLVAHTFEIDDPGIAAHEILEQLDMEHSLLENSAGFIFCSLEFIKSGMVEAVSKALPFDVIGCTTCGIAVPGAIGEEMLAVLVLTSDDCFFKTGMSEPLEACAEKRIEELYGRLSGEAGSPPSLVFVLATNPGRFSGDMVTDVLHRLSGGKPVFGTIALDETLEERIPLVICNGTACSDRLALLLVCGGAVESRFHVDSLPELHTYGLSALVTGARGTKLISINNMPAARFLENIGVISRDKTDAIYMFPLVVDNHDGEEPRHCGIFGIEEDGSLLCSSAIAEGATLKLVNEVQDQILRSSEQFAEMLKNENVQHGRLICSCFGRSAPLVDLKDELRLYEKYIKGKPYVVIYSRGEFCPVYDERGGIRNCFHQYCIISAGF